MQTKNVKKTKDRSGQRDKLIGKRIRDRRIFLGLSQSMLADRLGITFQQLQKYEMGHNKVSASRLVDLSRSLSVPMNFFCKDFIHTDLGTGFLPYKKQDDLAEMEDPASQKESMSLLRNYYLIKDKAMRESVQKLVKQMASKDL